MSFEDEKGRKYAGYVCTAAVTTQVKNVILIGSSDRGFVTHRFLSLSGFTGNGADAALQNYLVTNP